MCRAQDRNNGRQKTEGRRKKIQGYLVGRVSDP